MVRVCGGMLRHAAACTYVDGFQNCTFVLISSHLLFLLPSLPPSSLPPSSLSPSLSPSLSSSIHPPSLPTSTCSSWNSRSTSVRTLNGHSLTSMTTSRASTSLRASWGYWTSWMRPAGCVNITVVGQGKVFHWFE